MGSPDNPYVSDQLFLFDIAVASKLIYRKLAYGVSELLFFRPIYIISDVDPD